MRSAHRRGLLAVLLAACAAPAAGQRIDPERIFDVTVEVDGKLMTASVREGTALRLMLPDGGGEYHFSPVLQAGQPTRVLVAVSHGTTGQPQTQRIVERLRLSVGVPVTLRTAPTLRIVLDEIRRANQERASAGGTGTLFGFASAAVQDGQCCVCCEGPCACACAVSWWCGHCCTKGCCDPVQQTSNDRTTILTGPARFAALTRNTCTRGTLMTRPRTPQQEAEIRTALR